MNAVKHIGCICCRKRNFKKVPCEVHHLLSGGIRRGHLFSIGLCPWHHRAITPGGLFNHKNCRQLLGPSLLEGSKPFHAEFGSDEELLKYQKELVSHWLKQDKR